MGLGRQKVFLGIGLFLVLAVQIVRAREICYAYDLRGRLIAVVDQ